MGQREVLEAAAVADIETDEAGEQGGPPGRAMISHADVEKLRVLHAPGPDVLSLYLPVPLEADGVLALPARARDLIAAAHAVGPDAVSTSLVGDAERDAVLDAVLAHGRHWLGYTVVIFASPLLGLFEVLPLPCALPERSVLATRPHVRPLLAALQRCPSYRVVVADRRHAWVLAISGEQVRTVLARHRYRDVAAILEQQKAGDHEPVVIGGHQDSAGHLLRLLPPAARENFAGSFAGDPLRLTPDRVRELAAPVVAHWAARRERELTKELVDAAPGQLAAVGLPACLGAVNAEAVALLLVPDEGMVPGFECGRCGALSLTGDDCPDWGTAARVVPDLLEEMARRCLDGGGQVVSVSDAPVSAAARLRFPVPKGADR